MTGRADKPLQAPDREQPADGAGGVRVRPMVARDIDEVSGIEQRIYTMPWSADAFLTELTNPAASYLVAEGTDGVMGYAGAWVVMDEVHVTTLAVDLPHRRRGIARRLLGHLLLASLDRGAGRATLEVRAGNCGAQQLYVSFGFAAVGRRRKYYGDTGEDAVIMWADGIASGAYRRRLADVVGPSPGTSA